jgi:clan AA aspartic protease
MGEVRVKAKLTNATDRAMVRRGLLLPEQVRVYEADALIDTGAVRCVLPPHVVQRLGLDIVSQRVAEYADGRQEAVGVTEAFLVEIMGREEFENAMVVGDEVLIGQTALEKMDLFVDCTGKRLIPNPAHPDQPVSKIK